VSDWCGFAGVAYVVAFGLLIGVRLWPLFRGKPSQASPNVGLEHIKREGAYRDNAKPKSSEPSRVCTHRVYELIAPQKACPRCEMVRVKRPGHNGAIETASQVTIPRCFGVEDRCPLQVVHSHARCVACLTEWLEVTEDAPTPGTYS